MHFNWSKIISNQLLQINNVYEHTKSIRILQKFTTLIKGYIILSRNHSNQYLVMLIFIKFSMFVGLSFQKMSTDLSLVLILVMCTMHQLKLLEVQSAIKQHDYVMINLVNIESQMNGMKRLTLVIFSFVRNHLLIKIFLCQFVIGV